MTTTTHRFPGSEPIAVHLTVDRGSVDIVATDTDEVLVDISSRHDEEVYRVDLAEAGRHLSIEPIRRWRSHPRVSITVRVPTGSTLEAQTASAHVEVRGPLAGAQVRTASGSIALDQVDGPVEASSASGSVRVGSVGSTLRFTSASGSLRADHVRGDCEARSASGSITIGTADADVAAKSVSGSVKVGEARTGTLDLHATSGSIGVGVRRGTLVWLDVSSVAGRVTSNLANEDSPAASESPLHLHAHSVSGSIQIASVGTAAATGSGG
jgi:DUF4097 and DUF4098 domain-containing protein YvlB